MTQPVNDTIVSLLRFAHGQTLDQDVHPAFEVAAVFGAVNGSFDWTQAFASEVVRLRTIPASPFRPSARL